ncbi:MAG: protease modulator HflC [Hyphomicrobiaceae bacterium]
MKTLLTVLLFLLGIAAAATYSALFVVHQYQQALVLQFGAPQRLVTEPGLNWMIPFVQTVTYFDKRILDLETQPKEVIVSDKKRIVVDTFARYRIVDPLQLYRAVPDRDPTSRLSAFLDSAMRRVLGAATFADVVRNKRETLMKEIRDQVSDAAKELGVEIIDVRIKRADLPAQNQESIYARMKTERQREAAEFRAQGEQQSRRIRATADKQATIIRAEATKQSEILRGEGDAERNRIFAEAYGMDPDFFSFYRSMQAYEEGLKGGSTRMLLSPDSDFFRYFNDPKGRRGGAAPASN